jgi:hypothetical protein
MLEVNAQSREVMPMHIISSEAAFQSRYLLLTYYLAVCYPLASAHLVACHALVAVHRYALAFLESRSTSRVFPLLKHLGYRPICQIDLRNFDR